MGRNREVLSAILLCSFVAVNADVLYNVLKPEDPCISGCINVPLPPDEDVDAGSKYITTCHRGCRFFNLVDLRRDKDTNNVNNSLDACESSCVEAYTIMPDLVACKLGCAFMANQRVSAGAALFSIAINFESADRPNILLMPPDISENDVPSDPGLGKELLPGWWDSDGFKLPETYFKTVPIDSGTVDYGVSSEYQAESEKSTSLPGSDWLQCASRHTGIPRWLLAFAIATAALSALWLCLSPEKPNENIEKITLVNPSIPSKITVYLPDEAPLYKKPPPKYDEVVNSNDPHLQV